MGRQFNQFNTQHMKPSLSSGVDSFTASFALVIKSELHQGRKTNHNRKPSKIAIDSPRENSEALPSADQTVAHTEQPCGHIM